jgi:hypothetical protein
MRILAIIMTTILWFGVGLAQSTLENIAISKLGDSILVDIILSEPCQYEHSLTKVTPERIVVDLKKTINSWPQKNYTRLPLKTLSGVRTSQYQETPERVARVVLDVNRPVTYSVTNLPSGIRIKLPAVTGENNFALWQARGPKKVTEMVTVEKPLEAPKKIVAQAQIKAKTEPAETKKPLAKPAMPPPAEKPPVTQVALQKVENPVVEKPVVEKPKAEIAEKPKPTPPVAQTPPPQEPETQQQAPPPPPPRVNVGTELDAMPQRTVVEYEPGGERDPFKSLIGQGNSKAAMGKLPAVENLTLVGVLEEDEGNQALFEDAEGNGYILKPSDPVRNGYLASIQKDKAVFQITEYGWTRTVALNLKLPELK